MLFRHDPIVWVNRPDPQYYLGALGSLEEPAGPQRQPLRSLDLPLRTKRERTMVSH
jgi:hypothetical protein